ncbi:MAG TPA: alpha/beta fold hydrolase [Candidatus Binataceae bacterium]|nr:alpha/beta fold hydrolase [Candidatus Binataceae bacterium]
MALAQPKAVEIPPEDAASALDSILGANPFVDLDTRDIFATFGEIASDLLTQPARLFTAGGRLLTELAEIAIGASAIAPEPSDRRFADPTFMENPFYRALMQGYLAWRTTMHGLLDDGRDRGKAAAQHRFAMTLLTEALAPTNFFLGNPAALKRAFETAGQSLLAGLRNFLDDLKNNGGMPSQVDKRPFKVGETLAVTPGSVIYRGELCEIIQYAPSTKQVRTRPLLLVPPEINKYYVMDLAPKRSLIEYAVARGFQFFTISWRNPGPEYAARGLNDYVAALKEAVNVVSAITGSRDVNLLAVCAGGITSTLLMGHLAALGERRIHAATLLVTMLDSGEPSATTMFATEENVRSACARSRARGVLDAASLARIFAWLRPNDLVWNYWVNNYLMGKDPAPFDILYWNSDSTNLPAELHAGFLDLLLRNPLVTPNSIEILGTPIDLSAVDSDLYVLAGLTDHICSWRSCYHAAQLLGGRVEFVLNGSGHVQSLVSPPGNFKSRYFTNPRLAPTADKWREAALEHKGSWWEHWAEWLDHRSGDWREAPREPGNETYRPLMPAPGAYVHQRP